MRWLSCYVSNYKHLTFQNIFAVLLLAQSVGQIDTYTEIRVKPFHSVPDEKYGICVSYFWSNSVTTQAWSCIQLLEYRGNMKKAGTFVRPLLQWKRNKYCLFRVCVCSLSYTAYNAHALYCRLRSVRLYSILPHCLINGTIFGGEKAIEQKMCVLTFSKTCLKHFSER